jgi:hypothetical protein
MKKLILIPLFLLASCACNNTTKEQESPGNFGNNSKEVPQRKINS